MLNPPPLEAINIQVFALNTLDKESFFPSPTIMKSLVAMDNIGKTTT